MAVLARVRRCEDASTISFQSTIAALGAQIDSSSVEITARNLDDCFEMAVASPSIWADFFQRASVSFLIRHRCSKRIEPPARGLSNRCRFGRCLSCRGGATECSSESYTTSVTLGYVDHRIDVVCRSLVNPKT